MADPVAAPPVPAQAPSPFAPPAFDASQSTNPSTITTARSALNQQMSKLTTALGDQSGDVVTALQAITAAIAAKPSS